MRKTSLIAVLIGFLVAARAFAADAPRAALSLDGPWQAVQTRDAAETPPDTGWRDFTVPGTFYGTAEGGSRYAWLRREIAIPADWRGRRIFVELLGARYDPHVHVDGRLIGSQLDGFTPFEVEITDAVEPGSTHRLELRCQDWGATFVEGYELPPGGWAGKEPKGKVLAPIGGHVGFFGPWDSVSLLARPQVYLTDHVIVPSVRKGTLTVTGSLSDPRPGLWVDAQVLENGEPVLAVPPAAVGRDGGWEISAAFPDAHCWSPEDPHLYVLRVSLREGRAGPAVDVLNERFGFKEFWIEGPDFYLNGVKRHLLATSCWPPSRPESLEFVRRAIQYWKDANCVAFRQHTQPWRKQWTEVADEMGMMMIIEAAMWTDSGHHAYEDERFWDIYRDHLLRMVKRDRNNASVIMWSLENEFLHVGNDRWFPDLERKLAELGPIVKAFDPYHPITYESDLDPGGVADVLGLHYPHELPTHADYPNAGDWLAETVQTEAGGGLLGSRTETFFWERKKPLYIGEYLWVPTRDHSPGSVFFGDEAYVDKWGYNARAKALAWFDQTVAYRRAGVSGLCPWALGFPRGEDPEESVFFQQQQRAYEPVAAFLRNRDTRFFSGETVTRTFDVFNDSPSRKALELRWELKGTDSRGAETLTLTPAAHEAVEVEVGLPASEARKEYAFEAALLADGKEVHRQTATCRVEPRSPIEAPAGVRLLLHDPEDKWAAVFKAEGLRLTAVRSMAELATVDPPPDVVIIAPGALKPAAVEADVPEIGRESADSEQLAAFLGGGGRLLVLEQDTLQGLPVPAMLVEHASTMTFPLDAAHPVLEGIGPEDLKFWRGDHYVTRREVRRPTASGARAIAVSGGNNSLNQAPLLELHAGRGSVLLVQALVGEKLNAEPAARQMLQNALDYLAAERRSRLKAAVLSESGDFTQRLGELGVLFKELTGPARAGDLGAANLLILHGGGPAIADSAEAIRSFLGSGDTARTVYWHAPDADTFTTVQAALGDAGLRVQPVRGPVTILRRDHALLRGVSREDVHFTGPVKDWMREADVDLAVVDRALAPAQPEGEADRIEAEAMEVEGGIVNVTEEGVTFATNGSATGWIEVPRAGRYVLTVMAGGTPAEGVYPLASVRVNGREVAAVGVSDEEVRGYPVLADLPEGRSRLTVAFVNDRMTATEDRNMTLDAVLVGREPWRTEGLEVLTQPAALTVLSVGNGRLVLDGMRWDNNPGNLVKGYRYASALLANLGAPFAPPEPEPTWLLPAAFEPVGQIPYFGKSERELSLFAGGTVTARFRCVRAGTYAVLLRGHSTPAGGVYAAVELALDEAVIGEVEVTSGTDRVFTVATTTVSEGEHVLSARFTNDTQVGAEDRNLWLSGVGFRRAEPL